MKKKKAEFDKRMLELFSKEELDSINIILRKLAAVSSLKKGEDKYIHQYRIEGVSRDLCDRILETVRADGQGGCRLCCS